MIARRALVLLCCALGLGLGAGVGAQELPPDDTIAALKALVGLPANDRDALPLYLEIGEQLALGEHSREDLENGLVDPPLYREVVECGRMVPVVKDPFVVNGGKITLDLTLATDVERHLMPHMKWVRGLQERMARAQAEGGNEEAWNEVRRAMIVGLHFHESKGYLIHFLMGVAMLRISAQQALRSDIPGVTDNRALLEAVVETCQSERMFSEGLISTIEPLSTYLRMSGRNEKKVVYDFITIMDRLLEVKDHAVGGEVLLVAIPYVARADCDDCWEILFSCLPRLEDSQNLWIRKILNGVFASYEPDEVRRMLEKAYAEPYAY